MLESLLNNIEGQWKSQRTFYDFYRKKIKSEKKHIVVNRIKNKEQHNTCIKNRQINYLYKYKGEKHQNIVYNYLEYTKNQGLINKIHQGSKQEYKFKFTKNHLTIQYTNNAINYLEHVYFLNPNFKISVVIVKQHNNYIAIGFNSFIKIKN